MKTTGVLLLALACAVSAAVYHVELNGADVAIRDGRSVQAAWRSLAYACEQVSGPLDTIRLGSGTFVETRPSVLPDSVTIMGVDTASTRVHGSATWTIPGSPRDVNNNRAGYILNAFKRKQIRVINIAFSSADTAHLLHGAIWFFDCSGVEIANCAFTQFAWNGVCMLQSSGINLHHNKFHNASLTRDQWSGGQILVRWISNSDIHHNVITKDRGDGYGYKAQDAGHRNVRIRNNFIGQHYFAIESAHDQEYHLEICYNVLEGCISVPKYKGGPETLPDGIDYAVRIHHNVMHDSYGIEGPRNHMIIDSNYVFITRTGGRFYTQHHESAAMGPVTIHHNVIVNIDRGFVWAHNAGIAKNFHVFNNTVFCADAQDRTGALLAIPDSAQNWTFRNNIVVAPAQRPRTLFNNAEKGARVVTTEGNVFVNVSGVPDGNWAADPGLALAGNVPYPYYAPASAGSFVVDRGVDIGLPFTGAGPDVGAYEFVPTSTAAPVPSPRRIVASTPAGAFDILGRTMNLSPNSAGSVFAIVVTGGTLHIAKPRHAQAMATIH